MPVERRSVLLFFFVVSTLACGTVAAGCSESNPPASAGGGGGGTTLVTVDSGTGTARDAGADADSGSIDLGTPCLDEKSETIDGGAGSTDCASIASCSALCTRLATRYKLGVAQVAIDCLKKLGACSNEIAATQCIQGALGRACRDTTAVSYCSGFVTACDPNAGGSGSNISEADCEAVASSLAAAGRTQFAGCIQDKITSGTCANEVLACYGDLSK